MEKTFFVLQLRQVPRHVEEDVSALCLEAGAQGVSQNLSFIQRDLVYNPEILDTPFVTLDVYFESPPNEDLINNIRSFCPDLEYEVIERPHEDWMEGWKKHFKPFKLVGPFWIVPSWLQAPDEAEIVLSIDPGMAFGTGTHATTQIAAQMIYESRSLFHAEQMALDVGTGTSVLAMLFSHLGFKAVDATEIDPIARETAIENIEINKLQNVNVLQGQIEDITRKYDWVVANIIDGVLLGLKGELLRVTKSGGYLLLTGILDERKDDFLLKFTTGAPIELVKSMQKDEWWGFLFRMKT